MTQRHRELCDYKTLGLYDLKVKCMLPKALSQRLVKSEDLNHHKTFFAGRCAEWFVETSFIAVAEYINPQHIVCLKVHGLEFLHPIYAGDTISI